MSLKNIIIRKTNVENQQKISKIQIKCPNFYHDQIDEKGGEEEEDELTKIEWKIPKFDLS